MALADAAAHAERVGERLRFAVAAFGISASLADATSPARQRAWASLARAPSRRLSVKASRTWLAASSIWPAKRYAVPAHKGMAAGRMWFSRRRPSSMAPTTKRSASSRRPARA
jgi:hypothetical protein